MNSLGESDNVTKMDHLKPETVLPHFRGWLFTVVRSYYPTDFAMQNDLAQEGYIAMWKALGKFDPSKAADYQGALVLWVTKAAKLRMSDVVRRQTWTGTPSKRGHTRELPGVPLDALSGGGELDTHDSQWLNRLLGSAALGESVYLAYHQGEIYEALNGLDLEDRSLIYQMFWEGKGVSEIGKSFGITEGAVRHRWKKAQETLRPQLKHLETVVCVPCVPKDTTIAV